MPFETSRSYQNFDTSTWKPLLSVRNKCSAYPTNPFTIFYPRNQEIGEFKVVQERRATDFEAPKLWKGSSGTI